MNTDSSNISKTNFYLRISKLSIGFVALLLFGFINTQCSFKKVSDEVPAPYEERFNKDFFVNFKYDGKTSKITGKKDFICGWAAHKNAGEYGRYLSHEYPVAWLGCNVRFSIEKDFVVGKFIHNSYSDEGRWKDLVRIPIINHHYYEEAIDGRGRKTNKYIENTEKGHWSARPSMRLDLKNIQILDPKLGPLFGKSGVPSKVFDIEKKPKEGFLAFTITTQHGIAGSQLQAQYRFNFKQFVHNPKFIPTPFHDANSEYVAPIFTTGFRRGMSKPKMFASKWDTSKKHTIYLLNFPKEYEKIGFETVAEWNKLFSDLNHGKPFVVKVAQPNRKYAFDLRYTTINWIEDTRLNGSRGLLGVAGALGDMRNGELKWGMINMYGENIRRVSNYYTPTVSINPNLPGVTDGTPDFIQLGLMEPEMLVPDIQPLIDDKLGMNLSLSDIKELLKNSFGHAIQGIERQVNIFDGAQGSYSKDDPPYQLLLDLLHPDHERSYSGKPEYFNSLRDIYASLPPKDRITTTKALYTIDDVVLQMSRNKEKLMSLANEENSILDEMALEYLSEINHFDKLAERLASSKKFGSSDEFYSADFIQRLIGQPILKGSLDRLSRTEKYKDQLSPHSTNLEVAKALNPVREFEQDPSLVFDQERDLYSEAAGFAKAVNSNLVTPLQAELKAIRFTLLHELGHMFGAHHNFKENIIPKKGDIPDTVRNRLLKQEKEATSAVHSVMGYPSGLTTALMPESEIKPGFGDYLFFNYIYNRKYPIYPEDATGEEPLDQFVELDPEGNGKFKKVVYRNNKKYKIAFMPHCFVAAYTGDDPFCNTRDRGSSAYDLTKNTLEDYAGRLITSLESYSNIRGGNYRRQEAHSWYWSLKTFSAVRLFYDYMRQNFETQIKKLTSMGGVEAGQNLLDFAESCRYVHGKRESIKNRTEFKLKLKNKKVVDILSLPENDDLVDLCMATNHMIKEFEFYLTLPGRDWTSLSYKDKYYSNPMRVGDTKNDPDYMAQAYGPWTSKSRLPIKISALYALTSPFPFMLKFSRYGGMWLAPVHQYSRQDGSYHVSTLYSQEFSETIASATEMNLSVESSETNEVTAITRSILSMGYFLRNTYKSNDILRTHVPFIENIRDQTKFRYSLALVDVSVNETDKNQIAKKFSAKIHNIYDKGPESVPEIYMYRNDKVIMKPPPRSLLLPRSTVRWYSEDAGYFIAIKMDYPSDFYDKLRASSVRQNFKELYYNLMKDCIEGEGRNGLRYFFNENIEEFPGFVFPSNIHSGGDNAKGLFYTSLEKEFDRYDKLNVMEFNPKPKAEACRSAYRGQGLVVMAASVLNGFYFSNIHDYILKGYSW